MRGSPRDAVTKVLDYNIVVSEFELHSRYYVHFQTNTHGKDVNPARYVLNNTTTVII